MTDIRQNFYTAVHGVLIKDNQVLLGQRINTSYGDGCYSFPAGHLERFETLTDALVREMLEETDVCPIFNPCAQRLAPEYPTLTIEHMKDYGRAADEATRFRQYAEYFFLLKDGYEGAIKNMEPDKCADLRFFPLEALPQNMLPLARHALTALQQGKTFERFGWDNPDFPAWRRKHFPSKPILA